MFLQLLTFLCFLTSIVVSIPMQEHGVLPREDIAMPFEEVIVIITEEITTVVAYPLRTPSTTESPESTSLSVTSLDPESLPGPLDSLSTSETRTHTAKFTPSKHISSGSETCLSSSSAQEHHEHHHDSDDCTSIHPTGYAKNSKSHHSRIISASGYVDPTGCNHMSPPYPKYTVSGTGGMHSIHTRGTGSHTARGPHSSIASGWYD